MSTAPGAMFDPTTPNIARVYDFWLGGKDHFAPDRAEATRLIEIHPELPRLARENRAFLARAVTWLAGQGIRQFLDIGSGLPTISNTHEVARRVDPACRVVYADNDPVVVGHARAILADAEVAAVQADLTDPVSLLDDPAIARLIRPDEPTGLILALVLHFTDAPAAEKIMATLTSWLAPGSYAVLSVGSGDEETGGALTREYRPATLHNHSPEQIAAFFASLELVPPGLVDARHWNPGAVVDKPRTHQGGHVLAGVGRRPDDGPRRE
jgi:hypothetical protein